MVKRVADWIPEEVVVVLHLGQLEKSHSQQ